MSLKREIQNPNSPIGGFLRDVFPSSRNRALLAELHATLGAADPICLLDPDTPPWLRSYVGQAIDYRTRHHFQPSQADPIPMARDGIWAVTCVDDLPDALRRTPERFPDYALTAHSVAQRHRDVGAADPNLDRPVATDDDSVKVATERVSDSLAADLDTRGHGLIPKSRNEGARLRGRVGKR